MREATATVSQTTLQIKRGRQFQDMTEQRFGRLLVMSFAGINRHGQCTWLCRCDCGKEKIVKRGCLLNGYTRSCGCLRKDLLTKHGINATPEYHAWASMVDRCRNSKSTCFKNYGARGITVCERWNDLEAFIADMGVRPSAQYSLDRIDNELGYFPENCRWATREEQASNRRSSVWIEHDGCRMTVSQWSRRTGLNIAMLCRRVQKGWSAERIVTTPSRTRRITGEAPKIGTFPE